MELAIGITEMQPHWSLILDQIGAPYREVDTNQPIDSKKYSLIILSSDPNHYQKENITRFSNAGGGILTEANYARQLFETGLSEINIKYLLPDQDGVFSNIPL